MKGFTAFVACVLFALGCQHPSSVAPAGPQATSVAQEARPVELTYRPDPPVHSRKSVSDAEVYGWKKVDYIAYDLNSDGKSEYFLADMHHANKVTFVLIDGEGETLLSPSSDQLSEMSEKETESARGDGFICCDKLVILQSKHEGYFDILGIYSAMTPPRQTWELWVYKDGHYECEPISNEVLCTGSSFYLGGNNQPYQDLALPKIRAVWSVEPVP